MAKKNLPNQSESAVVAVTTQDVEARMLQFRGQYVLLDRDVAELYGVETKRINEAVKNNPKKFPSRYLFKLSEEETKTLAVEKIDHKRNELVKTFDQSSDYADENFDRKLISSKSRYAPTAFTEGGLYMLATILKSDQAIETTLAIIDTFTQVRQLSRTMEALQNVTDGGEQQQTLLQKTGQILANVVGQNLATTSTETEIELNFAVVKIKHKVVKKETPEAFRNLGI